MDALINLVSVPMALFVFVWALYRATKRCALSLQALTLVPRKIEQQLAPVRVTDPRLGRLGCPCGKPCEGTPVLSTEPSRPPPPPIYPSGPGYRVEPRVPPPPPTLSRPNPGYVAFLKAMKD